MAAPPNAQEVELLKTFRTKIADLRLEGTRANNLYLLSWIRARDGDLDKAEDMLRKSMEWRRVNKIDSILSTWSPPADFMEQLPFQISGYDKDGSPIAVLPFGRWDVRKFIEAGQRDTYMKYLDYFHEKLIEDTQKTEDAFTQFVIVVDMEGYSFRQLTGKGCVDTALETTKIFEANYPERLKACIIINVPKIFSVLFSLVKPLLTARTMAKLQIHASNAAKWKVALLNNVPADQLPTKYGGTQNLALNFANLCVSDSNGSGDGEGLIDVTVGAGEKLEVQYEIHHEKTKFEWKFKTDGFDIGFAVQHGKGAMEVVPYKRCEAHEAEQAGSYLCDKTGTYTFLFDNTYSMVRGKQLSYMVAVILPEGVADDEESTCL